MTATLPPKTFRSERKGKARCVGEALTRLPTIPQARALSLRLQWAPPCGAGPAPRPGPGEKEASRNWG